MTLPSHGVSRKNINPSWESVKNIIRQNLYLSAYASEGKYNDMDMLEIGRGMSEEEDKTQFWNVVYYELPFIDWL